MAENIFFISINKSTISTYGLLAQSVEHGADNAKVMSSSLIQTNYIVNFSHS